MSFRMSKLLFIDNLASTMTSMCLKTYQKMYYISIFDKWLKMHDSDWRPFWISIIPEVAQSCQGGIKSKCYLWPYKDTNQQYKFTGNNIQQVPKNFYPTIKYLDLNLTLNISNWLQIKKIITSEMASTCLTTFKKMYYRIIFDKWLNTEKCMIVIGGHFEFRPYRKLPNVAKVATKLNYL